MRFFCFKLASKLKYMKKDNPTYEFETIKQMLDVINEDNKDVLMEDFIRFLAFYYNSIKVIKEKHPKETEGKTNTEILNAQFVWTDDGISEIKSYTLTNKGSGLVQRVDIKKK